MAASKRASRSRRFNRPRAGSRVLSAPTVAMLAHLMPVEVVKLEVVLPRDQTRQGRLADARSAPDPQDMSKPTSKIRHGSPMMRKPVDEEQSSARSVASAE